MSGKWARTSANMWARLIWLKPLVKSTCSSHLSSCGMLVSDIVPLVACTTPSHPPRTPTPYWKGRRWLEARAATAYATHFDVSLRSMSPTATGL